MSDNYEAEIASYQAVIDANKAYVNDKKQEWKDNATALLEMVGAANLPVGTVVRYYAQGGWGTGTKSKEGRIAKVTNTSYIFDSGQRIKRDGSDLRFGVVIRTPKDEEKNLETLRTIAAAHKRIYELREAQREEKRRANRKRHEAEFLFYQQEEIATRLLIQRHKAEFESLLAETQV